MAEAMDSKHRDHGMVDQTAYKVIRYFENDTSKRQVIASGLTKAEAQAHCNNPETSSSTCTTPEGLQRTQDHGRWFDGWAEE